MPIDYPWEDAVQFNELTHPHGYIQRTPMDAAIQHALRQELNRYFQTDEGKKTFKAIHEIYSKTGVKLDINGSSNSLSLDSLSHYGVNINLRPGPGAFDDAFAAQVARIRAEIETNTAYPGYIRQLETFRQHSDRVSEKLQGDLEDELMRYGIPVYKADGSFNDHMSDADLAKARAIQEHPDTPYHRIRSNGQRAQTALEHSLGKQFEQVQTQGNPQEAEARTQQSVENYHKEKSAKYQGYHAPGQSETHAPKLAQSGMDFSSITKTPFFSIEPADQSKMPNLGQTSGNLKLGK